jgi:O-antigen ligase
MIKCMMERAVNPAQSRSLKKRSARPCLQTIPRLESPVSMRIAAAIFFALAVVAAQAAHGGLLIPVLAYPALALVALGALCALPAIFSSPREPWPMLAVTIVALSLYMLWRCANAPDNSLAMAAAGLILGCATMWAGVSLAVTRNNARFVFFTICSLAAVIQVIFAILQMVKHGDFSQPFWLSEELKSIYSPRFPQRPRGLYLNPNQFAWLMNAMTLMALSLGIWGRLSAIPRIALLYLAAVFGAMSILSGSRGGAISLLAGFCAFLGLSVAALLWSVGHRRLLLLVMGTMLLAICAGAVYLAFSTSWVAQGRLSALLLPEMRSGFAEQAIRLFQTEPFLGAGPGMYRYAARLYRTGDVSADPLFAHDDWLQFPAEYGFVGLAMFIVALTLALVAGSRAFLASVRLASTETGSAMSSSAAFVLGAVCALVAGAVHGNVDFNMHIPANALLAAALLGLVTGARPLTFESRISRFHPTAWLTAFTCLAAAAGLTWLLAQRGEAEYHSLQAANAIERGDIKYALEETEKGLRRLPEDATLLAQRGRGFFEYESWLEMNTPENTAEESSDEDGEDDASEEEPTALLSPAESAKNFRDSAEFFSRAIKTQPLERLHDISLANALAAQELDEKAQRPYIEAIRMDPAQSYAWSKYGDFLFGRDRWLEARRIYEIGAALPGGQYCRSRVELIDEDRALEAEEEKQ